MKTVFALITFIAFICFITWIDNYGGITPTDIRTNNFSK